MGSSWVFFCSTAFVWVMLSSVSGDERILQEKLNPSDQILQVHKQRIMLQRPVHPSELLEGASIPEMTPRGGRLSIHSPSVFVERYPVQFPLGRPTPHNLQAICLYGDRRPRYPKAYFPSSGHGSQSRKGSAVNKAESWLSFCCKKNQTWEEEMMLCCARQAWTQSIKAFCREEFSIKTSHFHCCIRKGNERLNCFNDHAPNPNYAPTENPKDRSSFTTNFTKFNPSKCQRHAGIKKRGA